VPVQFITKTEPTLNDLLVLDKTRYQRNAVVQPLAARLGITLLFLPSRSPNLNSSNRGRNAEGAARSSGHAPSSELNGESGESKYPSQ